MVQLYKCTKIMAIVGLGTKCYDYDVGEDYSEDSTCDSANGWCIKAKVDGEDVSISLKNISYT